MRLSIVVNMYNTAQYMPRCMESLLEQDIPATEYEIILVNDGSPDNSLEMANDYAVKAKENGWPTISVCSHENKGLAGARNTGVDAARGEYLCFVDPDDYIEKNSFAALLQKMDDEQLDMLRFNYQKVDENYQFVPDSIDEAHFDYSDKIMTGTEFLGTRLGIACYVWAYIYRLNFIRKNDIRFYEGGYFDDTPWLPRVLQAAKRVNCLNVRHQYYLQRSGSLVHTKLSASIKRKCDGQMALIEEMQRQMQMADKSVWGWYKNMIAHATVSILTAVSVVDYSQCKEYINKLQTLNVFPIRGRSRKMTAKVKLALVNISPKLYCTLIRLKNK